MSRASRRRLSRQVYQKLLVTACLLMCLAWGALIVDVTRHAFAMILHHNTMMVQR